ncbi:MAG TPA: hypothetical protein VLJ83_08425, partial [Gemmatimonadaceae bacterium]|nr:hypothetical protein [Gemmatimonadaceae bacterium]
SVNAHTLYVSYWARLSANWQGGGIHKQFYAYSNHASMYLDLYGMGSAQLEVQIAGQDILAGGAGFGDASNPDWTPKLAAARVGRNVWYHVEVLLAGNSDGKADGSVDWYLNGVHVGSHSGIQWSSTATVWNRVHFTNLWNGGTVPNTQTLDFDDFYLSGR